MFSISNGQELFLVAKIGVRKDAVRSSIGVNKKC